MVGACRNFHDVDGKDEHCSGRPGERRHEVNRRRRRTLLVIVCVGSSVPTRGKPHKLFLGLVCILEVMNEATVAKSWTVLLRTNMAPSWVDTGTPLCIRGYLFHDGDALPCCCTELLPVHMRRERQKKREKHTIGQLVLMTMDTSHEHVPRRLVEQEVGNTVQLVASG